MLVTLNHAPLDRPVRSDSLAALLDDVRAQCPDDELIVSVAVNGEVLTDAVLAERMLAPLQLSDQVDLETGPRERVVAEALRAVAEQVAAAGDDQRWAADRMSTGDFQGGMQQIGCLGQLLQTVSGTLQQSAALLRRDLTLCVHEGRTVAQHLAGLSQQLQALRQALLSRDAVLLGDMLHFDLPELCETWASVLRTLAEEAHPAEKP